MSFIDDFSFTKWRGLVMVAAAASLTLGCGSGTETKSDAAGSDSNDTATGGPTPETTPAGAVGPAGTGIATGNIKVTLFIENGASEQTGAQTGGEVQIHANDANDEPLLDPILDLLVNGKRAYFDETGWANSDDTIRTVDVSVRSKTGSRTRIHLVGPSNATITLLNSLAVNTPNTLQWLPNNEEGVISDVETIFSCNLLWASAPLADPGKVAIPATGFSTLSDFAVTLRRQRAWDDGEKFHADFVMVSLTSVGAKSAVSLNPGFNEAEAVLE